MLPLTFSDAADYDRVRSDDKLSLKGLKELAPGKVRSGGGTGGCVCVWEGGGGLDVSRSAVGLFPRRNDRTGLV